VQCLQATTLLRARRMIAPKVLFWWPDARSIEKVESIQESGQSNVVSSPLHEVEVASGRSSENCCPCALGNPTLHEEWAEVSRDRFRDEDNMLGPISRAHRHRVEEGLLEAEGKKTLRSYTVTLLFMQAKKRRGEEGGREFDSRSAHRCLSQASYKRILDFRAPLRSIATSVHFLLLRQSSSSRNPRRPQCYDYDQAPFLSLADSEVHMDKVIYCVDADPRPTCVLDLASPQGPHICHKNNALQEQSHLVHDILDTGTLFTEFHAWALNSAHSGTVTTSGNVSLHAYTIEKTWRVIQWLLPEKQSGHGQNDNPRVQTNPSFSKSDSSLNRKLEDALADRDDATGKLSNLRQMMEMVDVGMFEYDKEGVLLYGNDAFHSLAGVPKGNDEPMAWAKWVFEEDKPWLTEVWTGLTNGRSSTFEMRWIGSNPDENPEGQWVTAACVPTTDDAGNVTTVSGCITDISAQKRSHSDAVKKAEALERAQASEMRFSDFITHSNSAFYNFGMDRKVSTERASKMWTKIA
jgi:PAS domain S-box-containing protein